MGKPIGGGNQPSSVAAPVTHHACGAAIIDDASAKIPLEVKRIRSVNVSIAAEIPVAGCYAGAGVYNNAPAEIRLEGKRVSSVNISLTVKVPFAVTCIPDAVSVGGIGVFLTRVEGGGAVI